MGPEPCGARKVADTQLHRCPHKTKPTSGRPEIGAQIVSFNFVNKLSWGGPSSRPQLRNRIAAPPAGHIQVIAGNQPTLKAYYLMSIHA